MSLRSQHTEIVKGVARKNGFSFCGISKAEFLEDEAPKFEEWLRRDYQGEMGYLERNFDKRLDPTLLVPGAKSVISLLYNYYPEKDLSCIEKPKIAKYAYGEDYHFVIKRKLKLMVQELESQIGQIEGRVFVDSAPVHERAWAAKSGTGWIGKNSLLLNREMGSFFFLAEIISDLDLNPDGPIQDYCGTCTACQDACPTDAIPEPYVVDGSRCISYLTIELKEEIPSEYKDQMEGWAFGCDICQDVCPWNRFAAPHTEDDFKPGAWKDFDESEWQELTADVFSKVFKNSPLKRTGYQRFTENLKFVRNQD